MQSHLCPAMDPILVQPNITRPLPPTSSGLGVCPDQIPMLLSTQLTLLSTQLTLLLLQPFTDTTPPYMHTYIQEAAPGPQTNRILCRLPPSTFPAHPHTHWVTSCAGSVGFFLIPVCTHWSLCPEEGSSVPGHRRKMEDGTCHPLLLLQGAPMSSVFPQSSVGALGHL